jgi:hypothetical protein
VWIPRSVTTRVTKMGLNAAGFNECVIEVENWFAEKEDL